MPASPHCWPSTICASLPGSTPRPSATARRSWCSYDRKLKKVRLVWHRVFQPSPTHPLDFEGTVETSLHHLSRRFRLREVRFDPYQMQAVAQRLTAAGIPMVEFPQSIPNLTESSTNLWELIKGANLIVYPDAELRLAVQRAVAVETPRGWKISKTAASHKIDAVVALGMAALGAIGEASRSGPFILSQPALQKFRTLPPRDRFSRAAAITNFNRRQHGF
jgi:hypothetical protein